MYTTSPGFYVTGGTLRQDTPSYVERQADQEQYDGLTRGEYCYVLTARQMGKSSLMVRTAIRLARCGVLVAGLALLAPSATGSKPDYSIQSIVRAGDRVGDLALKTGSYLYVDALNDAGQLLFTTETAAGGETLIQHAGDRFTLIFAAGREFPGGTWPRDGGLIWPSSMNERGNVAFATWNTATGDSGGAYLWDAQTGQVTPVAEEGVPAAPDMRIFGTGTAALNSRDEIALSALLCCTHGEIGVGLFLWSRGGTLQPVALPRQALPGGRELRSAFWPTLNDAGMIAFLEGPLVSGRPVPEHAYLWEQGTFIRVAGQGADIPGGGTFHSIDGAWVNNQNRTVLVAARSSVHPDQTGLYRFANGQLTALIVPGQEMPGGGKLLTIPRVGLTPIAVYTVSAANSTGQHAFLARLEDGRTAAYRLDPDGRSALLLRSDTTTALGAMTHVGGTADTDLGPSGGLGLNRGGQVALPVRIAGDAADRIVLLTPTPP
jgi:hypothetical protein